MKNNNKEKNDDIQKEEKGYNNEAENENIKEVNGKKKNKKKRKEKVKANKDLQKREIKIIKVKKVNLLLSLIWRKMKKYLILNQSLSL